MQTTIIICYCLAGFLAGVQTYENLNLHDTIADDHFVAGKIVNAFYGFAAAVFWPVVAISKIITTVIHLSITDVEQIEEDFADAEHELADKQFTDLTIPPTITRH